MTVSSSSFYTQYFIQDQKMLLLFITISFSKFFISWVCVMWHVWNIFYCYSTPTRSYIHTILTSLKPNTTHKPFHNGYSVAITLRVNGQKKVPQFPNISAAMSAKFLGRLFSLPSEYDKNTTRNILQIFPVHYICWPLHRYVNEWNLIKVNFLRL